MRTIGLVGVGFVGNAVLEGMIHAFKVQCYDKYKRPRTIYEPVYSAPYYWHEDLVSLIKGMDGSVFVCVPTPMNKDGSCSTKIVEEVVQSLDNASQTALEDFKNQDRIIVGGPREATDVMKLMYEIAYPRVLVTKISSTIAEIVKYITNVFLATKVSLSNEFKQISDALNIDYDKVLEYATKDKRLGTSHWAVLGPDGKKGFSGFCFPKDINAFIYKAEKLLLNPIVMKAVWQKNLEVRPERDWELLKGRAIVNE